MTTKAATGAGAVLSIEVGSTWTPILQLNKPMQFSGQKWQYEDVTNFGSPIFGAGLVKESLPVLVDPGEASCEGLFLPADPGQLGVAAAFAAGTLASFKLQLAVDTVGGQTTAGNLYAFSAFVQENPLPEVPFDKSMTIKISLKLNTAITVTQGS